jgi:hypothetical protein
MKTLLIALGLTGAAATLATPADAYYLRDCLRGAPCPGFNVPSPRSYAPALWSTAVLRSGAVLCSTAILPFAATIWSALLRLRLGQLPHVCRWSAYGYFARGRPKRGATLVSGLPRNSATHLHPDGSYHTYRHVRISMITVTAAMKANSASVSV